MEGMDDSQSRWRTYQVLCESPILYTDGQAGDGREQAILKHVLETAGKSPESVLATMDTFSQRTFLMSVGDLKGALLASTVGKVKPVTALELGSYVGYSAMLISSNLQAGAKLMSMEMSPSNANITRQIVEHAGLADKVVVVAGVLCDKVEAVKKFVQAQHRKSLDLVFIDHFAPSYLPDFLTLKEHGLLGTGTVIVADNMGDSGIPRPLDLIEYLAQHEHEYESVKHQTTMEYMSEIPDELWVITCK